MRNPVHGVRGLRPRSTWPAWGASSLATGRTAVDLLRRPLANPTAVNSSTTKGPRGLAGELCGRRCRAVRRQLKGSFVLPHHFGYRSATVASPEMLPKSLPRPSNKGNSLMPYLRRLSVAAQVERPTAGSDEGNAKRTPVPLPEARENFWVTFSNEATRRGILIVAEQQSRRLASPRILFRGFHSWKTMISRLATKKSLPVVIPAGIGSLMLLMFRDLRKNELLYVHPFISPVV